MIDHFTCVKIILFGCSVPSIIRFSRHEQMYLMGLCFKRHFSLSEMGEVSLET